MFINKLSRRVADNKIKTTAIAKSQKRKVEYTEKSGRLYL